MRKLVLAILMCSLGRAVSAHAADGVTRKTLARETEIEGYTCAKGSAFFYADGRLNECKVPRETEFGVAHIPAGSWINLREDGRPAFVFLEHDTEIEGYRCSGGNWLLGPREGAMTGLYPSGKLMNCWLVAEREVQGVPCSKSWLFSGDSSVKFYESGRLRSCKLAKDFNGLKRGQRFVQAP
jgi:hypothetical protein